MAIRLNAQFKQKGRQTVINCGIEGQRYLANKIIGNLVSGQPNGRQEYTPNLSAVKPVEPDVELKAMLNYWKNSWNKAPEQHSNEAPEVIGEAKDQAEKELLTPESFAPIAEFNQISEEQVAQPANEQQQLELQPELASAIEAIEDMQAQTHLHFFKNCRLTRKLSKVRAATDEGFSVRSIRNIAQISGSEASQQVSQEPTNKPIEFSLPEHQHNEELADRRFEVLQQSEDAEDQTEEQVDSESAEQDAEDEEQAEGPTLDDADRIKDGKTAILRVPEEGVVKSSRGTVQLLVQRNGRTMKPRYNQCGVLIGVEMSDGWELVYMPKRNRWVIFNHDGTTPLPLKITSVSFDQKGNLWYVTADGQRTIFYTDGTCETK